MRTALYWACILLLLVLFLGQALVFAVSNSQTYDEAAYLAAGYSYLARQDFRLMPEHPPLAKELAVLPLYLGYRLPFDPEPRLWRAADDWRIGRDLLYRSPVPADQILIIARLPNLVLGTLLVGLVGWWSYRLWGKGAALLGMALAGLEPNLVAHSGLATTDIGMALFTALTLYLLWEYAACPSLWLLMAAALAVGLALATKFSSMVALPFVGLALVDPLLPARLRLSSPAQPSITPGIGTRLLLALLYALLVFCVVALVFDLAYFGNGLSAWWYGLRLQWAHQGSGHPAFFLGRYSRDGWWAYFPVAFLIKTPLVSLVLIVASLVFFRRGRSFDRRAVVFLVLPAVFCFAIMMLARVNIGVRYVLVVYPLFFVAAARLATVRLTRRWLAPLLSAVGVALVGVSGLKTAPHQLAYFNELVGGPGEGYRYLSDSNLDWGQDLKGVKSFMQREQVDTIYLSYFGTAPPSYYGIRCQYAPSVSAFELEGPEFEPSMSHEKRQYLAIGVLNLQGVFGQDHSLYHWLYQRTPVAKIGYSIYVYDITGDADAHFQLAGVYVNSGFPGLAVAELEKVLALDPRHAEARAALATLRE